VVRLSEHIRRAEGGDRFVVTLAAALLHDIADWKFHAGDTAEGPKRARAWLEKQRVDGAVVSHVCGIIATLSYKGAGVPTPMATIEGRIVQDADRLDAMGAIGIARAFAYGGAKGRLMHDPSVRPRKHRTAKSYVSSTGTTINHFYEKLLLLGDRMNTKTGRTLAAGRHAFLLRFLREFVKEWEPRLH